MDKCTTERKVHVFWAVGGKVVGVAVLKSPIASIFCRLAVWLYTMLRFVSMATFLALLYNSDSRT